MKKYALLLVVAGLGWGQSLTTVTDTLYTATGTYCSGTLTLAWSTFTAPDGHLVYGGSWETPIPATLHNLSVTIEPGQYTASYNITPTGCAPAYEQWIVPSSGSPLTLAAVRSILAPVPYSLLSPTWFAQDGATPGETLCWSGSQWIPGNCALGGLVFPLTLGQGGTGGTTSAAGLANLLSGNSQGDNTNKVQMAGAVSGVPGTPLCIDVLGNDTTSGCTLGGSGLPFLQPSNYGGNLANAIAALPAGGGEVDLGCNTTYSLSSLTLTANTVLRGCGASTIIQLAAGNAPNHAITGNTPGTTIVLENLALDGNRANQTATGGSFLYLSGVTAHLHNVTSQNMNFNTAVQLDAMVAATVDNPTFLNNTTHGLGITGGVGTNTVPANTVITNETAVYSSYPISGCTNANPVVCSSVSPNQFYNGENITLQGASVAADNGQWTITVLSASTFSIPVSLPGASTGGTAYEGNFALYTSNVSGLAVAGINVWGGGECIQVVGLQYSSITGMALAYCRDGGITVGNAFGANASSVGNHFSGSISNTSFETVTCYGGCQNNIFDINGSNAGLLATPGRRSGARVFGQTVAAKGNIFHGSFANNPEYGVGEYGSVGTTTGNIIDADLSGNVCGPYLHDGSVASTTIIDHGQDGFVFYNTACNPDGPSGINAYPTEYAAGSTIYCTDCNASVTAGSSSGQQIVRTAAGWLPADLGTLGDSTLLYVNLGGASGAQENISTTPSVPSGYAGNCVANLLLVIANPGAAFSVGGFAPCGASQVAGRVIRVQNNSGYAMTITSGDTGSSVGNRISTGAAGNITTASAVFVYDSANSTWDMVSSGSAGGGSMVWPAGGSGVPLYNGSSGWGATYTVGAAANNLVQLNGSDQLPAVSGALITGVQASTAAALASLPTLCSAGQAPTGILTSGNSTGCTAYQAPITGAPGTWPTFGSAALVSSTCAGDLSGTLPGCTVASIGGKAISLAGSFTTTGAFSAVITVPSAGTWTLPAPGTLVAGSIATGANPGPVPYVAAANTLGEDASNHCWDATNHRLGIGTCAPAYPLDISFTVSNSPFIHISNTSADSGLYLESGGASNGIWAAGGVNNAGVWTAKATSASAISQNGGAFTFFGDTGLTAGNTYTPTGRFVVNGAAVYTGLGIAYSCTHGSNGTCGFATLSSGTTGAIATTAAIALGTAGSGGGLVHCEYVGGSGTNTGQLYGTSAAGSSVTCHSTNGSDANLVYWEIRSVQ